jgi:GntR family transcriptional regulator
MNGGAVLVTTSPTEVAYKKVARELRSAILQRQFGVDSSLPSEAELAARYRVSRHTVRRAFHDLVAEGMVRRVQGRGTFLATRDSRHLRQIGPIDDLGSTGDTRLEVIEPLHRKVHVAAAARLGLESDAVHSLSLRSTRNGQPICHTAVYVGPAAAAILSTSADVHDSGSRLATTVSGFLDPRLPDPIAEVEQSITAAFAAEVVARALDVFAGALTMRIDRLYSGADGAPVELGVTHFLPEHYAYRVRLGRTLG